MDHRWGIVLNEDQIDQPATCHISTPFWEIDEIGMPSLLDQAGCTYSMLEPSKLNMPAMLDMVHGSSGFVQQNDIGWSGSLSHSVVESADHGSFQIHGFTNLGSSSAFQGGQACTNLTPCPNYRLAALNSSVPEWKQRHHQQKNLKVPSTSCTRKAPNRNPTQREIHILSERQRREEMNEKLSMLRSILPRETKKDKASTITHAIKHLKELEEKVKSLRACKAIKRKQGKAENASSSSVEQPMETRADSNRSSVTFSNSPSVEQPMETRADNNRSSVTFSKQFAGDSEDGQSCKIEVQNLGTHAILKILCPWSSRLLLRTHKALDECRVDVVQSIMTKHGGNAVYYFIIEFTSGTPCIDKLMSTLEEASRITS